MTTRRSIIHLLADITFPIDPLRAGQQWHVSKEHARGRLMSARRQGYLFREGRHYSVTPELLQAWIAEGVLI